MLLLSCYNDAENNYYDPPWANQCYRRKDHYDDADDKYDDPPWGSHCYRRKVHL